MGRNRSRWPHSGLPRWSASSPNPRTLEVARQAADQSPQKSRVRFTDSLATPADGTRERFDLVISKDSLEHFQDPELMLATMSGALNDDGKLFITFGPPWYSPYGSHMYFFTRVPWVNLLFSERTVMAVRSRYRDDGAMRYEEVESGLNRMSVGRFERIVKDSGLRMSWYRYDCVKGLDIASRVPLLRELLINHVSCILERGTSSS